MASGKINAQRWSPKAICGCVFFQIAAEDDDVIINGSLVRTLRPFAVHITCDDHTFPFEAGTHGRAISGDWQDPYAYQGWLWHVGIYRALRERRAEFRLAKDSLTGFLLRLRLFHLEAATNQLRDTVVQALPEKRVWGGLDPAALMQTMNLAVQGMVGDRAALGWPYTVPADPPQPAAKADPATGYEDAVTGIIGTVQNEDWRRSAVIQIIAVTMGLTGPDDESASDAVLKIADFKFLSTERLSGSDERVLEVTVAGTTKPTRDNLQGAVDIQFGTGAVTVL